MPFFKSPGDRGREPLNQIVEIRRLPETSDDFHERFLENRFFTSKGDVIEVVEFRRSTRR